MNSDFSLRIGARAFTHLFNNMDNIYQNKDGTWCRVCYSCNKEITYISKHSAGTSERKKGRCFECFSKSLIGRKKTPSNILDPLSAPHNDIPPTVNTVTLLQSPFIVEVEDSYNVTVSMYPVTVDCSCGYSKERKVPWFPCPINWHCPNCGHHHKTHFKTV